MSGMCQCSRHSMGTEFRDIRFVGLGSGCSGEGCPSVSVCGLQQDSRWGDSRRAVLVYGTTGNDELQCVHYSVSTNRSLVELTDAISELRRMYWSYLQPAASSVFPSLGRSLVPSLQGLTPVQPKPTSPSCS